MSLIESLRSRVVASDNKGAKGAFARIQSMKRQKMFGGMSTNNSNAGRTRDYNLYDGSKINYKEVMPNSSALWSGVKTSISAIDSEGYRIGSEMLGKIKDYNHYRDVADSGMLATATSEALRSNKKGKKSLFTSESSSLFGNI